MFAGSGLSGLGTDCVCRQKATSCPWKHHECGSSSFQFFFHSDVSFYFLKRSNKNQSSYSCGWGERTGCSQARGGGFLLSRRGREEVPAYGIAPPRPRPVTPSSSDFIQDTSSGPRVTLAEASLNLRASVAPGKPAGKFRCLGF